MNKDSVDIRVDGHCNIVDDLGNTLLDKRNAVHPQNLARVFVRALANESNYHIHRIAFGNGGTTINAALNVTYNPPNDGQPPDVATWDSRLYNETYSEVIDDSSILLGTDPGSADINTGVRVGGGSVSTSDPVSVEHVSGPGTRSVELGVTSQVIIQCVLNGDEPVGQFLDDGGGSTVSDDFIFDEIGLYTTGTPALDSVGYQQVDVGNRISTDTTGLLVGQPYTLALTIDGVVAPTLTFTPPGPTSPTYGELCQALNSGDPTWNVVPPVSLTALGASVLITDYSGFYAPELPAGTQTFGYLTVQSSSAGSASSIVINPTSTVLVGLNPPIGTTLNSPVVGTNKGVQNDPLNPSTEQERLLTHLIFSPVLKAKNRALIITYTLTVSIARSPWSA